MRTPSPPVVALLCLTAGLATVTTQDAARADKPTLYLVATAHLDTQWNWTVQDSIRQFVPDTFLTNFKFIEENPHYVFNYEGAIHYMWLKEYYPEQWSRLQKHVAGHRWRLSGSWINAADVNVPSPESLMRQALYGRRFFRQEFGRVSQDIFLPDCFGFPYSLPSIARASGLSAFSTQKLTWGRPIPFPIGRWRGVDGSEVVAALNPGSYTMRLPADISVDPEWTTTANYTPLRNGRSVAFRYFGTGDVGGGPTPESVANMERAMANPAGAIAIRNTSADQLSRDLTDAETAALPSYEGELILKTHGTGCYTSQAALKAWNRQNELLADAAERAAVAATWLAGVEYPGERLREAWIRFLWHQFHDDLTGTSIPQAYQFSWNDELVSLNQFAGVLTSSVGAVAASLDTQGTGIPLVIYNPLSAARRDVVEAAVQLVPPSANVRVTDSVTGRAVPAQVLGRDGEDTRIAFLADVPSVGFKVFHVDAAATGAGASSSLAVTASSIENNRLSVKIDRNGDIASIYDKDAKRELLKAPVMLELRDNPSPPWPAWEVLYDVVQAPAREYVDGPTVRVLERGPVRAAIEITRRAAGSTFVQIVRLTEGGDRVDVENLVDWKSPNTLLKVSFPLAASSPTATYDLGLGTIDRTNNEPDQYEVPAQRWADVTDTSGAFGVGVISGSKYGWDKPTDDTLRLTLLHTPKPVRSYTYQSSNDLGHHRFEFAIAGHAGDWRRGRLPLRAAQFDHPLVAFRATAHPGPLGPRFSMLTLDDLSGQVDVVALKRAEDSDEVVARFQERYGRPAKTTVRLPKGVVAVREINAAEDEVGPFAQPQPAGRGTQPPGSNPTVAIDLKPYQSRTLAFRLQAPTAGASADAPPRPTASSAPGSTAPPEPLPIAPPRRTSVPIALPFNLDGVSLEADRSNGDIDGARRTLAGELLPQELRLNGVTFKLGPSAPGALNVLVPRGDRLRLPAESFDRVHVLAAAVDGDVPATFGLSPSATRTVTVREWLGPIGQWDSRLTEPAALRTPFVPASPRGTPSQQEIQAGLVVQWDPATGEVSGLDRIRPGFVKRDEIAWVGTHTHAPDGNQVYVASYLFVYAIDLPAGAREIRLPNDNRLRILAMTLVSEPWRVRPARALYAQELPESGAAQGPRQPGALDR